MKIIYLYQITIYLIGVFGTEFKRFHLGRFQLLRGNKADLDSSQFTVAYCRRIVRHLVPPEDTGCMSSNPRLAAPIVPHSSSTGFYRGTLLDAACDVYRPVPHGFPVGRHSTESLYRLLWRGAGTAPAALGRRHGLCSGGGVLDWRNMAKAGYHFPPPQPQW